LHASKIWAATVTSEPGCGAALSSPERLGRATRRGSRCVPWCRSPGRARLGRGRARCPEHGLAELVLRTRYAISKGRCEARALLRLSVALLLGLMAGSCSQLPCWVPVSNFPRCMSVTTNLWVAQATGQLVRRLTCQYITPSTQYVVQKESYRVCSLSDSSDPKELTTICMQDSGMLTSGVKYHDTIVEIPVWTNEQRNIIRTGLSR